MFVKKLVRLFAFLLIILSDRVFAQEIREYKFKDNLYLVGDRVFSLYYITEDGVVVIDPINEKIAAETLKSIRKKTIYL